MNEVGFKFNKYLAYRGLTEDQHKKALQNIGKDDYFGNLNKISDVYNDLFLDYFTAFGLGEEYAKFLQNKPIVYLPEVASARGWDQSPYKDPILETGVVKAFKMDCYPFLLLTFKTYSETMKGEHVPLPFNKETDQVILATKPGDLGLAMPFESIYFPYTHKKVDKDGEPLKLNNLRRERAKILLKGEVLGDDLNPYKVVLPQEAHKSLLGKSILPISDSFSKLSLEESKQ